MPSLSYNTIKDIKDISSYHVFIETGTYMGETILQMEKHFNELHTIEIKKEFYTNLVNNYKGKINFHLGESNKVLCSIVENIDQPTIFFLDGHWSAGNTGKGSKHVPIYEELTVILEKFRPKCVIIIDDFRLFGTGPNNQNTVCDWEDINKSTIIDILKDRIDGIEHLPSVLHAKDRFVIYLNALQ